MYFLQSSKHWDKKAGVSPFAAAQLWSVLSTCSTAVSLSHAYPQLMRLHKVAVSECSLQSGGCSIQSMSTCFRRTRGQATWLSKDLMLLTISIFICAPSA